MCTSVRPNRSTPMLQTIQQNGVDSIIVSATLIDFLQARHDQSLDGIIQKDSGPEWRRYKIGDRRYLFYRGAQRAAD